MKMLRVVSSKTKDSRGGGGRGSDYDYHRSSLAKVYKSYGATDEQLDAMAHRAVGLSRAYNNTRYRGKSKDRDSDRRRRGGGTAPPVQENKGPAPYQDGPVMQDAFTRDRGANEAQYYGTDEKGQPIWRNTLNPSDALKRANRMERSAQETENNPTANENARNSARYHASKAWQETHAEDYKY